MLGANPEDRFYCIGLMVSDDFFNHKSMGASDPQARSFQTEGHGWQDLCRGPLNIATY